jgi:hypothetical protein
MIDRLFGDGLHTEFISTYLTGGGAIRRCPALSKADGVPLQCRHESSRRRLKPRLNEKPEVAPNG